MVFTKSFALIDNLFNDLPFQQKPANLTKAGPMVQQV